MIPIIAQGIYDANLLYADGNVCASMEKAEEVLPALEEALATVRAGRAALLDVRLGRGAKEGDNKKY